MPGLIRSNEENHRQQEFLRRAAPSVDAKKLAVYGNGQLAYTLDALTPRERQAMNRAGYSWSGNCWRRESGPHLRVVK